MRTMAITDAQQAGAAPAAAADDKVRALARYADALAGAGVDVVQLRDGALGDGLLRRCTSAMVAAVGARPTRVVVNDRAHVAAVAGAAGLHLRAASMQARRVRVVVGPTALVGRSMHGTDEAVGDELEGLDYVVFGTVFASGSKPSGHPVAGLASLEAQVRATPCPVIAVGGITPDRCAAVASRGAAGVAGIGTFARAWRQGQSALDDLVAAMHASFSGPEAGR